MQPRSRGLSRRQPQIRSLLLSANFPQVFLMKAAFPALMPDNLQPPFQHLRAELWANFLAQRSAKYLDKYSIYLI
jgi:hypothetical protein